ncbi:MAG TPA: PHP domain-containing protein [Gammaproteobacteria bacterium]|nr:PHP domain-containing protein [Gammaproteobacteria bacterium]
MSPCYDLHAHSTASDGTLTPAELVRRAHARGVDVLALTDHDDVSGVAEAAATASEVGLTLVPGIELSVTWSNMTIHVVGLHVDPTCTALRDGIARQQAFRHWRAAEIARRLAKKGIGGAAEGARSFASGPIVSRTHFARYLVEIGQAASVREVFKRFLVKGKPGYVAGDWASLDEVLGWIHAAGGIAVVAHPARYRLTATRLRRLLTEFTELGGHALEVVSGSHNRDECRYMGELARRFALLASCGSDYHGPEQPYVELGRLAPLPPGCVPVWHAPAWPGVSTAGVA